jgi:oligopeptide/dipeptide ABC transporter ATP-binding protein
VTTNALDIEGLTVRYGDTIALEDVNLSVAPGEILGVLGESGCGKSTLASAIAHLLPSNGRVSGDVRINGTSLYQASPKELRQLRGSAVASIFQDPATNLNPCFTIGTQMHDALRAHSPAARANKRTARERITGLLDEVGIPDSTDQLKRYPHQLSGGMKQRVMIATALSLEPSVLVADEPTASLDATLAAQILVLLARLRDTHRTSIVLISHELGALSRLCDRVAVIYSGQVVEEGAPAAVFEHPEHPYTEALLKAMPSVSHRGGPLGTIPGMVSQRSEPANECVFASRCGYCREACGREAPSLTPRPDRQVRCLRYEPESAYHREHDLQTGVA